MISHEWAEQFAAHWAAAWNARDLERVLGHYTDDFEMSSPFIAKLTGEASGTLRGKPAVGA
jgi:ketosteroid isomerase-like protein